MIGILVTTHNRWDALRRTLPQVEALGSPVLVVDDGSQDAPFVGIKDSTEFLYVPSNRGLAAAMNIGLSYWLADPRVEWISYFQDDVDVHKDTLKIMESLQSKSQVLTGHDAGEHKSFAERAENWVNVKYKWSARATHLHAHRDFWAEQMPIPGRELGAPKRTGEGVRGLGSNVDWWIVRDGPRSCQKTKRPIICVPGLVRSFLWEGKDSCWNNTQKAGEDPPLRAGL
jgi:glycosyltransferase involved in cell wall biosynthesis